MSVYASTPRRRFIHCGVSSTIAASIPTPAATANRWPCTTPRSICRTSPARSSGTALVTERGMPSARPSRLPVPPASTPIGMPDQASAPATSIAVPSPPEAEDHVVVSAAFGGDFSRVTRSLRPSDLAHCAGRRKGRAPPRLSRRLPRRDAGLAMSRMRGVRTTRSGRARAPTAAASRRSRARCSRHRSAASWPTDRDRRGARAGSGPVSGKRYSTFPSIELPIPFRPEFWSSDPVEKAGHSPVLKLRKRRSLICFSPPSRVLAKMPFT